MQSHFLFRPAVQLLKQKVLRRLTTLRNWSHLQSPVVRPTASLSKIGFEGKDCHISKKQKPASKTHWIFSRKQPPGKSQVSGRQNARVFWLPPYDVLIAPGVGQRETLSIHRLKTHFSLSSFQAPSSWHYRTPHLPSCKRAEFSSRNLWFASSPFSVSTA